MPGKNVPDVTEDSLRELLEAQGLSVHSVAFDSPPGNDTKRSAFVRLTPLSPPWLAKAAPAAEVRALHVRHPGMLLQGVYFSLPQSVSPRSISVPPACGSLPGDFVSLYRSGPQRSLFFTFLMLLSNTRDRQPCMQKVRW